MSKTQKPAALHYAAILDDFYMGLGRLDATGAAAELRRLHAANEALLKALEEAKVLIGAGNDSLSEAARQSNVNVAWHKLDAAASQAPAVAHGRPTKPGWYVVLPPDFEYQNWVGPIADIDDRQPFLAEVPATGAEAAARVAAKWYLQAHNRMNLAGEAIAISIGHEIDRDGFLAGIHDTELARSVTDWMRQIDQRNCELASAGPTDRALMRKALEALEAYSRWAASMDVEMQAHNVITDLRTALDGESDVPVQHKEQS